MCFDLFDCKCSSQSGRSDVVILLQYICEGSSRSLDDRFSSVNIWYYQWTLQGLFDSLYKMDANCGGDV